MHSESLLLEIRVSNIRKGLFSWKREPFICQRREVRTTWRTPACANALIKTRGGGERTEEILLPVSSIFSINL